MTDLFSPRFGKQVVITHHARIRMQDRGITDVEVMALLERGEIKKKMTVICGCFSLSLTGMIIWYVQRQL